MFFFLTMLPMEEICRWCIATGIAAGKADEKTLSAILPYPD
jgi:uncharacterized protein CbrC (UPF0167 family)